VSGDVVGDVLEIGLRRAGDDDKHQLGVSAIALYDLGGRLTLARVSSGNALGNGLVERREASLALLDQPNALTQHLIL
jgi:hypothetical protein